MDLVLISKKAQLLRADFNRVCSKGRAEVLWGGGSA